MSINRATNWRNNGYMIADVARLGYLDGRVLDVTYGMGIFWRRFQPEVLIGCDDNPKKAKDICCDFRHLPFEDKSFDSVVYDPPYQVNGTPGWDEHGGNWTRYGVTKSWGDERENLIMDGLLEASRVAKRFLLVKCMDQVVGGHVKWQTLDISCCMFARTWSLEDRFDFLRLPRAQDSRPQRHARANYSSLLVFDRGKYGY